MPPILILGKVVSMAIILILYFFCLPVFLRYLRNNGDENGEAGGVLLLTAALVILALTIIF